MQSQVTSSLRRNVEVSQNYSDFIHLKGKEFVRPGTFYINSTIPAVPVVVLNYLHLRISISDV